jgi:hypothetical protein
MQPGDPSPSNRRERLVRCPRCGKTALCKPERAIQINTYVHFQTIEDGVEVDRGYCHAQRDTRVIDASGTSY